jgi:hypothetical protein
VRNHLKKIAESFSKGDFEKPVMTHSEELPGVGVMQRLKKRIRYTFHENPVGGQVRIVTQDVEALSAVHDFLRYQIKEHATGDPLTVQAAR